LQAAARISTSATKGKQKKNKLIDAINKFVSGGSTAGGEGNSFGVWKVAKDNFIKKETTK